MKKTTTKKSATGAPLGNPLKFFNDNKAKRSAEPKQNLRKRQDGGTSGPYEEGTQKYLDTKYPGTAMKFTGPVDPTYEADQRDRYANPTRTGWSRKSDLERSDREAEESRLRSLGYRDDFNTGMRLSEEDAYRRGGKVKKSLMKKGGSVKKKKK